MAYNYAPLQATALRLITNFGKAVTMRRTGQTVPDANKPWEVNTNNTDYTVQAVRVEYAAREIDGTVVRQGDRKYLVATSGLGITPQAGDQVIDTDTLTVVSAEILNPASTALIYTLQVRK